jgi:molybdate transport system regulatory protein
MRKSPRTSLPSLIIGINLGKEAWIGHGKIELLENISSCGSISAAGRAMKMSYRRAWLLVDEINRICGRAAVEGHIGGKDGGGAKLTPFGASLVDRYREMQRAVESAARKELRALQADIVGSD